MNLQKREKREAAEKEPAYFESEKLQKMQDAFCEANHVYCICVDRNSNLITTFSGSEEEERCFRRLFTPEKQRILFSCFSDVGGENVISIESGTPYLMIRGVAIRGESDYLQGIWLVAGVDREQLPEPAPSPRLTRQTTQEDFERSIALLERFIAIYFSNKNKMLAFANQYRQELGEKKKTEYLLQKSEVLTDILKMTESDASFTDITDVILRETGKYLKASNCALIQFDTECEELSEAGEWYAQEDDRLKIDWENANKSEFPFLTGRPYTVSSETMMPEPFVNFFSKYDIRSGLFLPININGKAGMYLCVTTLHTDRKWTVEDIHFANDIKRVIQTITVRRVAQNSLASSYVTIEEILKNAGCGVAVIDCEEKCLLYTNDTYQKSDLTSEEEKELEALLLQPEQLKNAEEFHARESNRWFEISYATIPWVDGRGVRLVTLYEVTKTKQYQEKMEQQASLDYLTGLYNRMRFEEDLHDAIHDAVCAGGRCAALFIDLDDFGDINDGLGHQVGDMLLKKVAEALLSLEGVNDGCYRIGGDEFVVLIRNRQIDNLRRTIERIQHIFTKAWILKDADYYCTMSMGVVQIPQDGLETGVLMQRADMALHTAKRNGKNCVEFYNSEQENDVLERLDMEKCLREAVERGCEEFEVYYQPLIDVTKPDKPCCGAEALVRWKSETLGMVMPTQFIPMAEYLGLINQIGHHVLLEACKRCKYWNDFGHPEYKVNVNLSVAQLLQKDIVEIIREALTTTGIMPKNLTLEITESLAVHDMTHMQYILKKIKELGVNIALDDFGTGYSSLNHIRSMPIDLIKIDRCFVEGIGEDNFSDTFVKSVSQIADALDMNICVEGVEDEVQCDTLGGMNVDMIQGFLFDKPLSTADFEKKYLM